jgi:hypothetical protein
MNHEISLTGRFCSGWKSVPFGLSNMIDSFRIYSPAIIKVYVIIAIVTLYVTEKGNKK